MPPFYSLMIWIKLEGRILISHKRKGEKNSEILKYSVCIDELYNKLINSQKTFVEKS
jgi:hypothetical protein